MIGGNRLYGRHWGTSGFFPGLHFEVCYYRPIEICIDDRLNGFEAGAQGEHRVARGFLPALTYSAHAGFRAVIGQFLARERRAGEGYAAEVQAHSPYRNPEDESGRVRRPRALALSSRPWLAGQVSHDAPPPVARGDRA